MTIIESDIPLFDRCVNQIRAAYKEIGHTLGWRFLCVSRKVLDAQADIVLVTINPGGDKLEPDHPSESCEHGVSYLVESWDGQKPGEHKLQKQVRAMFQLLNDLAGLEKDCERLMERSLISHFIPFRSPRFDLLPHQQQSLETGRWLWNQILPKVRPRLVICLGREVQSELRNIIPSVLSVSLKRSVPYKTGWGNYCADIDEYSGPQGEVRLLYLPHLSTWKLFSSTKCSTYMPVIMREAYSGISPERQAG